MSTQTKQLPQNDPNWEPTFSPWRHGGWYVDNLQYPSGAVGCVSRNYPDRKWRIACDSRDVRPTFPNRRAAAFGERDLIAEQMRDRRRRLARSMVLGEKYYCAGHSCTVVRQVSKLRTEILIDGKQFVVSAPDLMR